MRDHAMRQIRTTGTRPGDETSGVSAPLRVAGVTLYSDVLGGALGIVPRFENAHGVGLIHNDSCRFHTGTWENHGIPGASEHMPCDCDGCLSCPVCYVWSASAFADTRLPARR